MQIWSPSARGFIEVVDLYAYLPFIRPHFFEAGLDSLSGEELSVLLHEFTHLNSLGGYFGLVQTYHLANNSLCRKAAERIAHEASKCGRLEQEQAAEASWNVFASEMPDSLQLYLVMTRAYKWLFEGLALFAEFDCTPHLKSFSGAASHLFEFVVALNHYTIKLRSKEGGISLPDFPHLIKNVDAIIDRIEEWQRQARYKYLILNDTSPESAVYFAGYLLVKGMQRHLAQLDSRLLSPENFLIFANGYFFNDVRLCDLIVPSEHAFQRNAPLPPAENFQRVISRVMLHLNKILDHLYSIDASSLRRAIDSIANAEEKKEPFLRIDFRKLTEDKVAASGVPLADIPEVGDKLLWLLDYSIGSHVEVLQDGFGISDDQAQKVRLLYHNACAVIFTARQAMLHLLRMYSFDAIVIGVCRRDSLVRVAIREQKLGLNAVTVWQEGWLDAIMGASKTRPNMIDLGAHGLERLLDQADGSDRLVEMWEAQRPSGEDCIINCHLLYALSETIDKRIVFAVNRQHESFAYHLNGSTIPDDQTTKTFQVCLPFFNRNLMTRVLGLADFRIDKYTDW